jgi:hypothetical protein
VRFAASTLVLAALFAAGCGSDDKEGEPIPAADAQALVTQLDQTEQLVEDGTCRGARFQVTGDGQLEDKVAALPEDVDADVRQALEDGLDRLAGLIDDECGQDEEPETETDTTETEPEVPTETQETEEDDGEETETEPPLTETEPPPTETEPPPTETIPETPVPPDEGGGVRPPGGNG